MTDQGIPRWDRIKAAEYLQGWLIEFCSKRDRQPDIAVWPDREPVVAGHAQSGISAIPRSFGNTNRRDGYNEGLSRLTCNDPKSWTSARCAPKNRCRGALPRKSAVNIVWWSAERFAGLDRPLGVAPVNFTAAVCLR